jgi:hypothetical protein
LVIVSKKLKDVKNMAKRKKTKPTPKRKSSQKKDSKILNFFVWALSIVALLLIGVIVGYYFGYSKAQDSYKTKIDTTEKKYLSQKRHLEQKLLAETEKKTTLQTRLKSILNAQIKEYTSPSHELETEESKIPQSIHRAKKKIKNKVKLAIIIDDVMTKHQVRAIKRLHIPITMSFLPPSKARPNSARLAAKEKFYMVHLPMEAMHFNAEEPLTLRTTDSKEIIKERIEQLQKLFPRVKYINNHTGSKFTADEYSMRDLITILNDKKIHFIDSRTTAKTKAPEIMKEFGMKYISRDVFLDHKHEKEYIKEQIKKAIKIAKKTGWAVAIGHPHKNTLQALKESKRLLKSVNLVYINKIP